MSATIEEPILFRLERLDNILRQLEEIRGGSRSPKSSCPSTPTSGTLTSDGHRLSFDFSPKSMEKHCRPIDDVILETELKGSLLERLLNVEDRVLKLGLQLEEQLEAEKKKATPTPTPEKKDRKKGLKQLVKSCVKSRKHKSRTD